MASLQYNSENPTLISILFTVLCSTVLGIVIAFTYDKTSRDISRPDHFIQAMVLITIVAATIMQAIGDSVARGLGMLGALSIIRFRTTVRDPRNIVFMFGAIAAGIACGVFGFVIAFVGTFGLCITAFLLRFSAFSPKKKLIGNLVILLPMDYEYFPDLEKQLRTYCPQYELQGYRTFVGEKKAGLLEYQYHVKMKKTSAGGHLLQELQKLPNLKVISLVFTKRVTENI